MDMNYLLFLQDFRHNTQEVWTPLLENLSTFSVSYLLFAAVFIYWCVNKRYGLYTLAAFCLGEAVNSILKLTFCVYRPWIRDPRITPAGHIISKVSSYSFPSGHTVSAATLYGGMALGCWQKKSMRWLGVLCVILLLLTGFSRNYLGVHTPQDVLVGLCVGLLSLWGVVRAFDYLAIHPEQETRWLSVGLLLGILALIYITYKPYPMDYVNGKLLVNPKKMMNNGYLEIGAWIGFCMARYVEKRWINFTELGLHMKGVAFALLGLVPAYFWMHHARKPLVHLLGAHGGRLVFSILLMLYVMAFFPYVIKKFNQKFLHQEKS